MFSLKVSSVLESCTAEQTLPLAFLQLEEGGFREVEEPFSRRAAGLLVTSLAAVTLGWFVCAVRVVL